VTANQEAAELFSTEKACYNVCAYSVNWKPGNFLPILHNEQINLYSWKRLHVYIVAERVTWSKNKLIEIWEN